MGRLSYDPRELSGVMRMLERSSQLDAGSGRVPEWLSTHPDPGNRAAHIEEVVQESGVSLAGAEVRRNEYLQRIDGMVFGENPREGFFDGNVFHHPELAFRLTFPNGWQKVNTKQAVQAVSPNQDAAMELSLAEGSPRQALSQFGSQQGVQIGGTSQESVNGLSAAFAEFAVAAEQGTFRGTAMFVQQGGTTYRILGYAPESRWNTHRTSIERAMGSFQRETDPQVLAAQPERLQLVQLDRSYTLQSFLQRFPSSEDADVVALINGLESGAALPAGTLAKRVVSGRERP